jgi:hypothetical protein
VDVSSRDVRQALTELGRLRFGELAIPAGCPLETASGTAGGTARSLMIFENEPRHFACSAKCLARSGGSGI